jgi:prevent-host-death family protein
MTTFGAYDAKTQFSQLIRRVSRGERIVITHHGVPVAVLAPIEPAAAQSPLEVVTALKTFRQGRRLDDLSIRDLISEGRQ